MNGYGVDSPHRRGLIVRLKVGFVKSTSGLDTFIMLKLSM